MGIVGSFLRFLAGLAIFVVVLVLGIAFSAQLTPLLQSFPGTIHLGNVQIPLLASIVFSLALTIVINLVALPFRRNE
jgi:amino acid permease